MNKMVVLPVAALILVLLSACTHLQQEKPLPSEGESAVRSTEEEGETNMETPANSSQETQSDADVQVKF